jgi:hypothetical protein
MGLRPSPETLTKTISIAARNVQVRRTLAALVPVARPLQPHTGKGGMERQGRPSHLLGYCERLACPIGSDLGARLCLTLRPGECGGGTKPQRQASSGQGLASNEGVLLSLALPCSEVPQELGNWQVRRRPRQGKERGDQNPRPPIVIGRHASAPITEIAAKRARVR